MRSAGRKDDATHAGKEGADALAATSTFRKVNIALLVATSLIVVVGALGAYAWHRWQLERQPDLLLAAAERAFEIKDYNQAATLLSNYLERRPEDVDAMVRMAEAIEKGATGSADHLRASRVLTMALEKDPSRSELRNKVAELLLPIDPAQARKQAQELLAKNPNDHDMLRLRARALDLSMLAGGKDAPPPLTVIRAFEAVIKADPADLESTVRLADLLRRNAEAVAKELNTNPKRIADIADQSIEKMVRLNPKSSRALTLRYQYHQAFGQANQQGPKASLDPDLAKALELDPANMEAHLFAADNLVPLGLIPILLGPRLLVTPDAATLDQVKKHMDDVEKSDLGKDIRAKIAGATLRWYQGDRAGAIESLKNLEAKGDLAEASLALRRADFLFADGKITESGKELERAEQLLFDLRASNQLLVTEINRLELMIRILRATWYLAQSNPQRNPVQAANLLKQSLQLTDSKPLSAMLLGELARCYDQLDQRDLAISTLKDAIGRDPTNARLQFHLGDALRRAGRADESAAAFLKVLDISEPGPRTYEPFAIWSEVARSRLAQQITLPNEKRDWAAHDDAVKKAVDLSKDSPAAIFLEVGKPFALGGPENNKLVLDRLDREVKRFENSKEFWSGAFDIYSRMGEFAKAENALERFEKLTGVPATGQRANLELARGRPEEAARILKKNQSTEDATADERRLARQAYALLQFDRARIHLENVLAKTPGDFQSLLLLADIATQRFDAALLARCEERLKYIEGGEAGMADYLRVARLLIEARDGKRESLLEARSLANTLIQRRPNWYKAHTAAGMVAEQAGNLPLAIDEYEKAYRMGETHPLLPQKLAWMMLRAAPERFDSFLGSLPEEMLIQAPVLPISVGYYLSKNDVKRAAALASRAVAQRPGDAEANRMMGSVAWKMNPASAEEHFSRALSAGSNDPRTWIVALGYFIATPGPQRTMQVLLTARGLRELQSAMAANPAPGLIESSIAANCLFAEGKLKEADEFERLVRAGLGGDASTRAGQKPVDGILGMPKAEWDKRIAALPDWMRKSVDLMVASDVNQPTSNDALARLEPRLRAYALILRGGPVNRKEAMSFLEKLPPEAMGASELTLLARMANLAGETAAATKHYKAALAKKPLDSLWQEVYLFQLRAGELAGAEETLKTLESKFPDKISRDQARIELLARTGKIAEAKAIAKAALESLPGAKMSTFEKYQAAFTILRPLGRPPELAAIMTKQFQEIADRVPDDRLFLAEWMAEDANHFRDALTLCLGIAESVESAQPLWSLGRILLHGNPNDDEMRRINNLIVTREQRQGIDAPDQLAALGWVSEVLGRYNESVKMVTRAAELRPFNPAILNNLAWLTYAYQNKLAEAIEKINQSILVAGPISELLDTRAVILAGMKRPLAAIAILEGSVLLDSRTNSLTYLHLADIYRGAGDAASSQRALATAKRIGLAGLAPKDQEILRSLEGQTAQAAP